MNTFLPLLYTPAYEPPDKVVLPSV
jgi:hypothetical protein